MHSRAATETMEDTPAVMHPTCVCSVGAAVPISVNADSGVLSLGDATEARS